MSNSNKLLTTSIAIGVAMMGQSHVVVAQQKDALRLEEVIVTSRKKDEMEQDVPLTINAFTDEALDKAGIINLQSLSDFTPGFDFAQAFGRQDFRPAIRGQSTIQGGSNAGLFVDGFFIGKGGPTLPYGALQSVEVIKGPQSALYGRSTMSGAVNYALKKPSYEFEGEAEVTAGEDGLIRTDVTASGPITEQLGYTVSVSYYEQDGQWDNNFAGQPDFGKPPKEGELGGQETTSLVGVLQFNPTDSLEIIGRLMYEDSQDDPYAIAVLPPSENNCFRTVDGTTWTPPSTDPAVQTELFGAPISLIGGGNPYNGSGYYCGKVDVADVIDAGSPSQENDFFDNMGTTFEALRLGLTVDYELNSGHLLTTSIAYHDYEEESRSDLTFGSVKGDINSGVRSGFITDERDDSDETQFEFRVTSPDDGALRYLGGIFYYEFEQSGKERGSSDGDPTLAFGNDLPFEDSAAIARESWSVFGQIEYDFTDTLSATVELRYNEEEVEAKVDDYDTVLAESFSNTYSETYEAVLPRASINWFATSDILVYGVVARGNKPGDVNTADDIDPIFRNVEEEKAWSYELGTKTAWLDGALTVNLSAFYIDWEDQQLTTTQTGLSGVPGSVLDNLGETTIQGFELEVDYQLTSFWNMYLGYSYIDSEIEEYLTEPSTATVIPFGLFAGAIPNSGYKEPGLFFPYDSEGNVVISGTQLPQVSEDQVVFSNTFTGAVNDQLDWFFRVDYLYSSPRYAQVYNLAHTGHKNIVNLKAGINADKFDVEIWVKNLEDDNTAPALIRYVENADASGPSRAIGVTLPERRQAGITARYRF